MSSDRRGSLYLLPNTLGDVAPDAVIPAAALDRARSLDYIIAEDPKAARAFLKRIGVTRPLQSIYVERLDHNTQSTDIPALLEPLLDGRDAGLLSEAGLPAIADPGASLVRPGATCAREGRTRRALERALFDSSRALRFGSRRTTFRVPRLPPDRRNRARFHIEGMRTPVAEAEANSNIHRDALPQRPHSGDDAARPRPGYARVCRHGPDPGIGIGENATRRGMAQGNAATQGAAHGIPAACRVVAAGPRPGQPQRMLNDPCARTLARAPAIAAPNRLAKRSLKSCFLV